MDAERTYQAAFNLLRQMFSAQQLYWLARRMQTAGSGGWGSLHIHWRNGHVDGWDGGPSEKANCLPPIGEITGCDSTS